MPPCHKRKQTTTNHSGEAETHAETANVSSVQPIAKEIIVQTARKLRKLSHDERWHRMLEELKAYEAERGDCLVPQNYSANPQLGSWVRVMQCFVYG